MCPNSFRSTSSRYTPSGSRFCSSSSCSHIIVDVSSTLMSRLTRRQSGPRSIVEAFPFDSSPKYLLRDRDRIYGLEFRKQIDAMGIKEVLSAPRSPWQRAYVERVIGSIRRECLDHVIVFDEKSLRCTLRSYFSYYHRSRVHLSLNKDSPDSRPVQSIGEVIAIPEVGGLHHRYERHAA